MSTMTLKQVSHMLRSASEDMVNPRYRNKFKSAADAIDAHLAAQEADAVPVAFRIVDRHGPYPWVDGSLLKPGEEPETIIGENEHVEYAYAAPVAQEAAAPAEQVVGDGVASIPPIVREVLEWYASEVGLGWSKARTAPKTYKLMKEIIYGTKD